MHRGSNNRALRLLLLAFLIQIAAVSNAADKIRLAVPDVGGQFLTFPLAQHLGFLKQEGIDAEIVLICDNAAMAAISGGDVDYTVGIPHGVGKCRIQSFFA